MKKTAFILMILTIFSKILGFTREISLSYFYGASSISDAYLISLTIPLTIFAFIGVGISTSYIPMYSDIEKNKSTQLADRFTNNIINVMLILCSVLVIIGLTFTGSIVKVFASGFEGDTLEVAIKFTRISLFGIYFSGLAYVFTGYLQMKKNFIIPALIGVPFNFFSILTIALSTEYGINIMAVGSVLSIAFQLVLLVPFAYKIGYKYRFTLCLQDNYLQKMMILSLPVIIGVSVNQINVLVDRTIASQIVTGGVSAINYANRLNWFIQGIFVSSIATAMYPTISKMAAEHNIKGLKKSLSEAVSGITLLVVPAALGSILFAGTIVELLFGRGAFDIRAIIMTSEALVFYSIGMIGIGLREVLSRVFYALQDTKTPTINAAIGMVINIILNIVLSKYLGIGGLALATSISAIFTTILLFISLRKKIGPFGMKQISISFLKILFASLVMGFIAKLSFNYLTANIFSQNLSLIISIGIGALTYFTIIYFMKIDDVDVIVNAVKKKLKRSKVHV